MALEYRVFTMEQLTNFTAELAVPIGNHNRSANHLKFDMRHQQRWTLIPDKVNFVCDFQAGKIIPLGKEKSTFCNDRFYLYNAGGYTNLGHS